MSGKKLTDNEIIKALEDEIHLAEYVDSDFCSNVKLEIIKSALDLITRQQAENENLKVENQSLRSAANSLKMHYEEAQAQIERLKENRDELWEIHCRDTKRCLERIDEIDTLKEELKTAKSEAVKECLAKVKNYIKTHCNPYGKPDFDYDTSIRILNFINNLVKEMVGENNDL